MVQHCQDETRHDIRDAADEDARGKSYRIIMSKGINVLVHSAKVDLRVRRPGTKIQILVNAVDFKTYHWT